MSNIKLRAIAIAFLAILGGYLSSSHLTTAMGLDIADDKAIYASKNDYNILVMTNTGRN